MKKEALLYVGSGQSDNFQLLPVDRDHRLARI